MTSCGSCLFYPEQSLGHPGGAARVGGDGGGLDLAAAQLLDEVVAQGVGPQAVHHDEDDVGLLAAAPAPDAAPASA